MIILAVETSCDETSIAVLKIENRRLDILSNIVSSQVKLHAKYGGVFPSLAKREHQKNLPIILKKTIKKADNPKIDIVAVINGPGLEICLWQGINFAKDLAKKLRRPLVPVNHIEAHIIANFISENSKFEIRNSNFFPAVCLVVSGGHTQLILMKDIGKYKLIGETRDDAAGECFDKAARILGLGYPGGPKVDAQAAKHQTQKPKYKINLPRPMIAAKNYDFSFSGLKTAVLYDFKNRPLKIKKSPLYVKEMCFEVQQAIIDVLLRKTIKAAKDFKVKSIILGGGVAACQKLKERFKEKIEKEMPHTKYFVPDVKYCTDNALMVALTAYFHRSRRTNWQKISADANLKIG